MSRFSIAMIAYAAIALLARFTLTEQVELGGRHVPMAWIVWALLAMFALRTWLYRERLRLEDRDPNGDSSGVGPM